MRAASALDRQSPGPVTGSTGPAVGEPAPAEERVTEPEAPSDGPAINAGVGDDPGRAGGRSPGAGSWLRPGGRRTRGQRCPPSSGERLKPWLGTAGCLQPDDSAGRSQSVEAPVQNHRLRTTRRSAARSPRRSAAATTLLGLALVLLSGGLVVAQALEIGEDPRLRDLAFEAAQGGFDSFVLADGHLGHEKAVAWFGQWAMVASAETGSGSRRGRRQGGGGHGRQG